MLNLEGVDAKIDRARTSLRNLDSEISHYCNCRIEHTRREALNLGYRAGFLLGGPADLPTEWPVAIGEIAYNLRSSLDHLIWQLVIHNGKTPTRNSQFPIFLDKTKYGKAAKRQVKGVGSHSRKLIEESQPFQENNRAGVYLWILHSICNIDKHRHLNLVDHYSSVSAHLKEDVNPELFPGGLFEGLELFLHLEGTGQEHKVELDVNLQVCFMDRELQAASVGWETVYEGSPEPYLSVVSTLSGCLESVDLIVGRLRP